MEVEPFWLPLSTTVIIDFGMEVAHLRVFLDVEVVLHVSSDAQAISGINCYHLRTSWSLKDVKLNHSLLGSSDDSELTKAHLEHHVFLEVDFLSDHDECSSCASNISDIELSSISAVVFIRLLLRNVFDLAVTPGDKAFTDDDIIAG